MQLARKWYLEHAGHDNYTFIKQHTLFFFALYVSVDNVDIYKCFQFTLQVLYSPIESSLLVIVMHLVHSFILWSNYL